MKLLAWDTSSKAGAIVALEWDHGADASWDSVRIASELSLNVDSQHSEQLLWGIHQVLESAKWKLDNVDCFAVGVGPGSFTGLRIGVTTARTLAHTLSKPLIGVSSLAALARPAALELLDAGKGDATVVASTDACKGELFCLWGKASAIAECAALPGLWNAQATETVLSPVDLVAKIPSGSWLSLGEGRQRYPAAFQSLSSTSEISSSYPSQVQARFLGMLAWEAHRAGLAGPALEAQPRYVRASDAELKLKAGLLKPQPVVPKV